MCNIQETAFICLAAGKGTRLGLTDVPKPMAMVIGKPMMDWYFATLDKLRVERVNRIVVVKHLKDTLIQRYSDLVGTFVEQGTYYGPMNATLDAFENIPNKYRSLLISFGDDVTYFPPEKIQRLLDTHQSGMTLALTVNPSSWLPRNQLYGANNTGNITGYVEDDSTIVCEGVFCGAYIIDTNILQDISKNISRDKLVKVGPRFLALRLATHYSLKTQGVFFDDLWISANDPKGLQQLNETFIDTPFK